MTGSNTSNRMHFIGGKHVGDGPLMSALGHVDIAMSALSSAIRHTGHYHGGNEGADQGLRLTAR